MRNYRPVTSEGHVSACAVSLFAGLAAALNTHGMGGSARISDWNTPKQRTPGTQEVPL